MIIIALAVFMAAATVFEARRGAEAAQALFYRSTWLAALLAALGVNILASTLARWPFSWRKVGFLMTHVGILVVLLGAVMTNRLGLDGRLYLVEGQPSAVLSIRGSADAPAQPAPHHTLPFTLRLERFERQTYPGTDRAAMFSSQVLVSDEAAGRRYRGTISMNRPMRFAGYRFYQSGFDSAGGLDVSILSVSRDPGRPVVFVGFALVCLGVLTMIAMKRLRSRPGAKGAAGFGPIPITDPHRRLAGATQGYWDRPLVE